MSKRWLWAGVLFIACVVIVIGMAFSVIIYTAPRMKSQEKIEEFSAVMPIMPAGSIAADQQTYQVQEAPQLLAVPADNSENQKRGKIYFQYYCQFCHGADGRGDGPVGQSYLPVPSDLATPAMRQLASDVMIRRMLKGFGHEPVLENVVLPAYRPFIALYLRHLGEKL